MVVELTFVADGDYTGINSPVVVLIDTVGMAVKSIRAAPLHINAFLLRHVVLDSEELRQVGGLAPSGVLEGLEGGGPLDAPPPLAGMHWKGRRSPPPPPSGPPQPIPSHGPPDAKCQFQWCL